jgi:hypothetical protein
MGSADHGALKNEGESTVHEARQKENGYGVATRVKAALTTTRPGSIRPGTEPAGREHQRTQPDYHRA